MAYLFLDFKEKPFCDFLKAKKLSPTILHFVQHSIAMVTDEVSTEEVLRNIFLKFKLHLFLQMSDITNLRCKCPRQWLMRKELLCCHCTYIF